MHRFDWATFALAALPAVVAVAALVHDLLQLREAVASRRWPAVTGTVVTSGWKGSTRRGWAPEVVYRYEVDGKTFEANRIGLWGVVWSKGFQEEQAEEWSQRWVDGHEVQVLYDPARPWAALLLPGLNWRLVTSVLIELFCAGVCVYLPVALFLLP